MIDGLIVKGIAGFYYVDTELGLIECKPRGIFRKKGEFSPLIGDNVLVSILDKNTKKGVIEEIKPRKNSLIRPSVANIEQVVIMMAAKSPEPDLFLLDKLIAKISSLGLDIIICINKIDLSEECKSIFNAFERAGFKVKYISARNKIGMEFFQNELNNKITILAGPSGVGKSTVINSLDLDIAEVETGKLSEKIERGKHTTRHVELFPLRGKGYIADTPGFSSFTVEDIDYKNLQHYYPEFEKFINVCKFTGCLHLSEPLCAVKIALANKKIDEGRYSRYVELLQLIKKASANKY